MIEMKHRLQAIAVFWRVTNRSISSLLEVKVPTRRNMELLPTELARLALNLICLAYT